MGSCLLDIRDPSATFIQPAHDPVICLMVILWKVSDCSQHRAVLMVLALRSNASDLALLLDLGDATSDLRATSVIT